MTVKEKIIGMYGSLNKFADEKHRQLGISRTSLYRLVNDEKANPTMSSIAKLAELIDMPLEEVIHEYCSRYRDQRTCD